MIIKSVCFSVMQQDMIDFYMTNLFFYATISDRRLNFIVIIPTTIQHLFYDLLCPYVLPCDFCYGLNFLASFTIYFFFCLKFLIFATYVCCYSCYVSLNFIKFTGIIYLSVCLYQNRDRPQQKNLSPVVSF